MTRHHPSAVAVELARLSAVADARLAAAAAAEQSSDPAHPYLAEVGRRAAHAATAAAAAAAAATPLAISPKLPPRPVIRIHCSELSLARFRREFVGTATPVVGRCRL